MNNQMILGVLDPNLCCADDVSRSAHPQPRGLHASLCTTEELLAEIGQRYGMSPLLIESAILSTMKRDTFEMTRPAPPNPYLKPTPQKRKSEEIRSVQPMYEPQEEEENPDMQNPPKKRRTGGGGGAKAQKPPHQDLSDIILPGEELDKVMIFDTCDEIRRKITAYLRRAGVTQASLLRELRAQFHTPEASSKLQQVQLTRFRGYKGVIHGNTSSIYYAAYVFFEKLRIKEGKEKSELRIGMEREWPEGVDTKRSHEATLCSAGRMPVMDKYGMTHYIPDPKYRAQ